MNMEKLNQLYESGSQIIRRIGGRNIFFFGLLGTAVAAKYCCIDIVTFWTIAQSHITNSNFSREWCPLRQCMSIPTDSYSQ